MLSEGKVGLSAGAKNTQNEIKLSQSGALLASQAHGRYADASREGRLYFAYSTVAVAPVAFGTEAAQQMVLWNPPGSGVDASILTVSFGITTVASAAGALGFGLHGPQQRPPTSTTTVDFAGSTRGDGGAGEDSGGAGKVRAYEVGTVSGPEVGFVPYFHIGTGALTVETGYNSTVDVGGLITIPPGYAVSTQSCDPTLTALIQNFCVTWEEIPRA